MQKVDFRLNAIVDASLKGDLVNMAQIAALNGATIIQYRDKLNSTRIMFETVTHILEALSKTSIPLIINDHVDIVLATGAHGVHLGKDDLEPNVARRILGVKAIIGRTVKNYNDVQVAIKSPIDYACIGGIFETQSKYNPDPPIGIDGFTKLCKKIRELRPNLPIGAISGVNIQRISSLITAGADGVAVISAIFSSPDIGAATRSFRKIIDENMKKEPYD